MTTDILARAEASRHFVMSAHTTIESSPVKWHLSSVLDEIKTPCRGVEWVRNLTSRVDHSVRLVVLMGGNSSRLLSVRSRVVRAPCNRSVEEVLWATRHRHRRRHHFTTICVHTGRTSADAK